MKRKMTAALLTIILAALAACGSAFAAIPTAPDPFYAADFADVLEQQTEDYIIEQNGMLENACGAQIVVVTTDFLDGMDIEDYAYKLFNAWKIGDAQKGNGVLLLLAIGEDNYWCVQGKGLEDALPSADIGDILWDNLEDDFAAGDYDSGVQKTFDALFDTVYNYYDGDAATGGTPADEDAAESGGTFWTVITGIIMLIVFIAILWLVFSLLRGIIRAAGSGRGRRRGSTVYIPPMRSSGRKRAPGPPPFSANDRRESSFGGLAGRRSSSRPAAPARRSSSSSIERQSSGSCETILRQPSDNQQVVVFEQADRQRTRRRRDNPRRRSGTQRQIEARPSNKEKSPAGSKLNAGQAQKNRQTNVRRPADFLR